MPWHGDSVSGRLEVHQQTGVPEGERTKGNVCSFFQSGITRYLAIGKTTVLTVKLTVKAAIATVLPVKLNDTAVKTTVFLPSRHVVHLHHVRSGHQLLELCHGKAVQFLELTLGQLGLPILKQQQYCMILNY